MTALLAAFHQRLSVTIVALALLLVILFAATFSSRCDVEFQLFFPAAVSHVDDFKAAKLDRMGVVYPHGIHGRHRVGNQQ